MTNKIKLVHLKLFKLKALGIMMHILSIFSLVILILAGVLLICSPGNPKPYLDKNGNPLVGSISEKIFININGVKQGMFIKSKNKSNPVLLYLHGGLPEYFLTQTYPTGLEDYFTVVWWEQRGSGLSYSKVIPPITLEQMISDTKELTNFLRKRFGQDKIYLMGHSGGSFIGIQTAAQAPELYHAYIGIGQMSNQLNSELLAYEYMLKQFTDQGNKVMIRNLKASPVTISNGTPDTYLAIRDKAMHMLGIGTTHDMNSVVTGIFLPSLMCRDYSLNEKINLWRGKSRAGVSSLWNKMLATDLSQSITQLEIPVYFIHGIFDYTVSYTLAKDYFDKIKAPQKGFYTFGKSAHSPMFEEPQKMVQILREDVLNGLTKFADSN